MNSDRKESIKELGIIYTSDYPNARSVREVLSELRKDGYIFIKSDIGKGVYVAIEKASKSEIAKYAHAQIRHFKTHYFNTVLPMKQYVEEQEHVRLFGRLEGVLSEDAQ